jgi:hypothetical protein
METLFNSIVLLHIVVGSVGLASFWVPVFARKQKGLHTQAGKIFAYAMMVTAISAAAAAILTLIDPLATHPETSSRYAASLRAINGLMLLYLAAITFNAAFAGLRAVRMKRCYGGHRALDELFSNGVSFVLAIAVLLVGWQTGSVLMMALSAIGIMGTPGNVRLIMWTAKSPWEWKYQHMGSMLGAGIAAHTAFLVFGAGRFVDSSLSNSVLVWLAPTLIGIPATLIWTRYYRRQEQPLRASGAPAATTLEVQS